MKWSEQMRVLNSEDEHYNQMVYDVEENALYINDKLVATLTEEHYLDQNKFLDLKKKYPYIDDKNFLLNCLFKLKKETSNPDTLDNITYMTLYGRTTFVNYAESENGSYIEIAMVDGKTIYTFRFITDDILKELE